MIRTVFIAAFLLTASFALQVNERSIDIDPDFFNTIINWVKQFICPQKFNFSTETGDDSTDEFMKQIKAMIQMLQMFICYSG